MVLPDRDKLRAAFQRRGGLPASSDLSASSESAARDELLSAPDPLVGDRDAALDYLRRRLPPAPRAPLVELPPGREETSAHGPYWRRELRYPLASRHGRCELGRALQIDRAHIATLAKDPAFAQIDPRQFLFLDTETTGLHGGAGTVVFAFGLAHLEEHELVLEQLFLRDFGEEEAMLRHVQARLRSHPVPVSYVGKSFDRHRIAARMSLHRIRTPILTGPHLDLYHVARRVWGKQLPDCRLRTIEERRLDLHRTDDLPGSEAPIAFLQWLRDRRGQVDRVLEHNRLDVLSVVALLGLIGEKPPAVAAPGP